MGAHLCSLRRRRSARCEELHDEFINVSHSSLAELLSLEYSNNQQRRNKRSLSSTDSMDQSQSVTSKLRKLSTLEEWLMASPRSDNTTLGHGELYVFRNYRTRVFPASPMMHHTKEADLTQSLTNMCMKNVPVIGEAKKRVSFKLPEEADVIVFDSPKPELQAGQDSSIQMHHESLSDKEQRYFHRVSRVRAEYPDRLDCNRLLFN